MASEADYKRIIAAMEAELGAVHADLGKMAEEAQQAQAQLDEISKLIPEVFGPKTVLLSSRVRLFLAAWKQGHEMVPKYAQRVAAVEKAAVQGVANLMRDINAAIEKE